MKVRVKDEPSTFVPREITITIQSEKELCNLWLRTRLHEEDVNKLAKFNKWDNLKHGANDTDTHLHIKLDELVENYKLIKK